MNKAKEKAEEMVKKYFNRLGSSLVGNPIVYKGTIVWTNAVDCALICVEEIIKSSPSLPILSDNGTFGSDIELSKIYWLDVKQELIKMKG